MVLSSFFLLKNKIAVNLMAFVDEAKFFVKGGDGGRGCVSFLREKFIPKGGPDGGDGGNGGSVYIEASHNLLSLNDFHYRAHFLAHNGVAGMGKKKHGKNGKDLVVLVPLGSLVKDAETGEILADLTTEGDSFLAASGGEGGQGNTRFATAHNRAPRRATPGHPGEERWLKLELKLLADVGLIGLPNAGKSTLLSKLSAARPRIAAYPFTTLEPQLGILRFDFYDKPCVIADIPGLIAGAHSGAGLGHKFLRHIERTRVLLHVIDASGEDDMPWQDFQTLDNELRQYKDELASRERFIVLNKIDTLEIEERLAELKQLFASHGHKVMEISALEGTGVPDIKGKLEDIMMKTEDELLH